MTVATWYNKLLYNNTLDLFFVLVIVYHLEKGLDRTKPFKTEHILQGPWPFIIILKFHFTNDQWIYYWSWSFSLQATWWST